MTSASGQELRIYQSESTTPYITRAGALTSNQHTLNQHTLISSGITANANSYTVHFDTVSVADDWLGPFDSQPPATEPTALRYDGANWIGLDKPVVIA